MILSFMLHTHSSSREIQLGWQPRGKKKCVHLCVCVVVTTHDSFHPLNGRVALNQSINKDQQSLFAHSSSISRLKILFSPLLPWLITPRHALSAAFSSHPPPPPPPHPHPPQLLAHTAQSHTNTSARGKVQQTPNLNKFTIIASPVVTEVWIHLCLTFQTSSWLDPPVKKRLWGLFNRDPNRVSLLPALASWLKDRFLCYLSGVWGCSGERDRADVV